MQPPAAKSVSEEEERNRVLPVIRDLKRRRPDAIVSVDTYKASVARAAVEAGAEVTVGGSAIDRPGFFYENHFGAPKAPW